MATHIVNSKEMTPQCSVYTKGKSAGYRHDNRFEFRHLQSPFLGTNQSTMTSTVKDATTKFYGYNERPQIMKKRVLASGQFMERPLYAPNRKCNGAVNVYVSVPQSATPVTYGITDRSMTLVKSKEKYTPTVSTPLVKVMRRPNVSSINSVPSRVNRSKELLNLNDYAGYNYGGTYSRTALYIPYN